MSAAAKPARTLRGGVARDSERAPPAPMRGRTYSQAPYWTDTAATALQSALQAKVDQKEVRTLELATRELLSNEHYRNTTLQSLSSSLGAHDRHALHTSVQSYVQRAGGAAGTPWRKLNAAADALVRVLRLGPSRPSGKRKAEALVVGALPKFTGCVADLLDESPSDGRLRTMHTNTRGQQAEFATSGEECPTPGTCVDC